MWVKLGHEYLNLDQVIRVRFSKAFRNGQEELAAEIETLVKGEEQIFTRYRGAEAAALQAVLATSPGTSGSASGLHVIEGLATAVRLATSNTPHDVNVP